MLLPILLALATSPADQADQLLALYQNGDAVATIQFYTGLLRRPDELSAVESSLRTQKAPPFAQIVLDSRLASVHQELDKRVPSPGDAELAILIGPLVDHLTSEFGALANHDLMQKSDLSVSNWSDGIDLFWEHYALENRITQLEKEIAFLDRLAHGVSRTQKRRLDERVLKDLDPQFIADLKQSVARLAKERREREMESRWLRLSRSAKVLARTPLDADRFVAAGTWRIDRAKIIAFLQEKGKPAREALQEPGLTREVEAAAAEAKRLAGPLTDRAETLFEALFWWTRGRFGTGTHDWGLAKHPLAYRDESLQMQLIMPAKRPVPVPPAKSHADGPQATRQTDSLPQFHRRNQYWWIVGDRQIQQAQQIGFPEFERVPRLRQCVM